MLRGAVDEGALVVASGGARVVVGPWLLVGIEGAVLAAAGREVVLVAWGTSQVGLRLLRVDLLGRGGVGVLAASEPLDGFGLGGAGLLLAVPGGSGANGIVGGAMIPTGMAGRSGGSG